MASPRVTDEHECLDDQEDPDRGKHNAQADLIYLSDRWRYACRGVTGLAGDDAVEPDCLDGCQASPCTPTESGTTRAIVWTDPCGRTQLYLAARWRTAGSRRGERPSPVLARLTHTRFRPVLTLPSGGDCSCPGTVWLSGSSDCASQAGPTDVFPARMGRSQSPRGIHTTPGIGLPSLSIGMGRPLGSSNAVSGAIPRT